MHQIKHLCTLTIITLIALNAGCSSTTALRQHPSLEKQLTTIDRVVVAPPDVNISLVTFTGNNTRLPDQEAQIKPQLISTAKEALETANFEFVDIDFESLQQSSESLAYDLENVKRSYQEAKQTLYAESLQEKDIRSVSASIGGTINPIAEATLADAVLLIDYNGFRKSGGKMTQEWVSTILLGVLTGAIISPIREAGTVHVALLDAVSGDVLWANSSQGYGLDSKGFSTAMKKLPGKAIMHPDTPQGADTSANEKNVTEEVLSE